MSPRAALCLVLLLVTAGCGFTCPSSWLSRPCPRAESPMPAESTPAPPLDRTQRLTTTRADLKTALTALELRAVTACSEGRLKGEGCIEIQKLIDQGRALDERLVKALLDPIVPVDWPGTTALLRAIVQRAH